MLLYYSLFLPHLNYGILSWGTSECTHLDRIYKLQKWAVRMISNKRKMSHHEPLCKKLNILKLKDIYNFRCYKLIKSWQLNLLPSSLSLSFTTINASNLRSHRFQYNLIVPYFRLKSSCSHVFHFGAKFFNNLPNEFKINNISLERCFKT